MMAVGIKGPAPADAADRFIDFLAGPEAQLILRRGGPGACPICDGEKCVGPTSAAGVEPSKATEPDH